MKRVVAAENPFPFICPAALAQELPRNIFLGTSSWTHEFWRGQVYRESYTSVKDFNNRSLREFAAHSLFRIVEIDSTFYAPPKSETLELYATLVPETFRFTAKIWERLSIPVYPAAKRYGKFAGRENESFLSTHVFLEEFLPPFRQELFAPKFAGFLLQFPKMPGIFATSKLFLQKLEAFLEAFPQALRLAIEIRNPELLKPRYITLLNKYGVSHCFSQWHIMPPILEQLKVVAAAGGMSADFYLARLITPQGVAYEKAKELFEPFFRLGRRDDAARADVLRIVKRALQRDVPAYVIVNNRFEGNSPETVRELAEMIVAEIAQSNTLGLAASS